MTDCFVCERYIPLSSRNARLLVLPDTKHLVCNSTCLSEGEKLIAKRDLELSEEASADSKTSTLALGEKRTWSELKPSLENDAWREQKDWKSRGEATFLLDLAASARLALETSKNVDLLELQSIIEILSNDSERDALVEEANAGLKQKYVLSLEAVYRKKGIRPSSPEGKKKFQLDLERMMKLGANALRKRLEMPLVDTPNNSAPQSTIKKGRSWSEISKDSR